MNRPLFFAFLAMVSIASVTGAAPVHADEQRGRLLYENHCQACHASVVHVREHRKVESPAALRAMIQRWATERKLTWRDVELADVYDYLNNRFYKFPVETPSR